MCRSGSMSVLATKAYLGLRSKTAPRHWSVLETESINCCSCASRRLASVTKRLAASVPVLKRTSPWRRKRGLLRQLLLTFMVWWTPSTDVTRDLRGVPGSVVDEDKARAATAATLEGGDLVVPSADLATCESNILGCVCLSVWTMNAP